MSRDTDAEQLLQQAIAGNEEALGRLLQFYQPILENMSRDQMADDLAQRVSASDIVQASFLSAIRNIKDFVGDEPVAFIGWLKQIHLQNIREVHRNHIRREKRSLNRETSGLPAMDHVDHRQNTPSAWAIQKENRQGILKALASLPELQATVVRLRHIEGMKLNEIAAEVDRTPQAVAGLLKRGLKALREHFEREANESQS